MAVLTLGEDGLISICADIFTCLPANTGPLIIANAEREGGCPFGEDSLGGILPCHAGSWQRWATCCGPC